MNNLYLQIGPLVFNLTSEQPLEISDEIKQFFIKQITHQQVIYCTVKVTNEFAPVHGNLVFQNGERLIYNDRGKETRIHFFNYQPYGIYREIDDNHFMIEVITPKINILFIELFALEKYLLNHNALILHSAFIQWHHQGIVFSAPSQTGKSTQAALWKQYQHATIINGDRSILVYDDKNNHIEVWGLPFCGSSKINLNEHYPLKAIVFLKQAPINEANLIEKSIASCNLFKEISVNKWNLTSIDQSLALIEKIIANTLLISLKCKIDQDAVNVLKTLIKRDCNETK